MTASASLSLRKAIRTALLADAQLTGASGVTGVFDTAPRQARTPYITWGEANIREWATTTESGIEHSVVLHVWSAQPGSAEALAIADRVRVVIASATLVLDGQRLVNIAHVQTETRRDNDGRLLRASLRFRAVTEAD